MGPCDEDLPPPADTFRFIAAARELDDAFECGRSVYKYFKQINRHIINCNVLIFYINEMLLIYFIEFLQKHSQIIKQKIIASFHRRY